MQMSHAAADAYLFRSAEHAVAIDGSLHQHRVAHRLTVERLSFLAEVSFVNEIIQDQGTGAFESGDDEFDGEFALARVHHLNVDARGLGGVENVLRKIIRS